MRLLLYSPDSYGLGHVKRSLKIAGHLLDAFPGLEARVLTGSPRAHYFDYPYRCDYVRLPRVTKNSAGHYVPGNEEATLQEVVDLRSRIISSVTRSYRPDVFLVDHDPLGLCGEVLPVLRETRDSNPGIVRVLGLRDVIDDPIKVRRAWRDGNVIEALREGYDRILVYGQQDVFDPIAEYGIPRDVAAKMRFVGYIPASSGGVDSLVLRARFAPRTKRLVAVTVGGGGDGNRLLHNFIEGYRGLGTDPPFEVVAVTGPLMSPRKRERYHAAAAAVDGLTVVEFMPDMPSVFGAADFVVCMGGYNTVCEAACAGASTLIVPRSFPRREQFLRAEVLSRRSSTRYLAPESASPQRLMAEVRAGLAGPRQPRGWRLDFGGLVKIALELGQLSATAWTPALEAPAEAHG